MLVGTGRARKGADGVTSDPTGMCDVCGKPGIVHLTEIRDGVKTSQSLCVEHAPPEIRDKLPATPAEEVAHLRKLMGEVDRQVSDPAQREEFKADIERLIADIEAGRRRLGDAVAVGRREARERRAKKAGEEEAGKVMDWKRWMTMLGTVVMLAWSVILVTPLYDRWHLRRWIAVVPLAFALWAFYDVRTGKRHRNHSDDQLLPALWLRALAWVLVVIAVLVVAFTIAIFARRGLA
jgi:hypothetical protein